MLRLASTRAVQSIAFRTTSALLASWPSSKRHLKTPGSNTNPSTDLAVFKDIKKLAKDLAVYEHVLWTGKNSQIVTTTLPIDEATNETKLPSDHHVTVVDGEASFGVDGNTTRAAPMDHVVIPAGATHTISNVGDKPLVLYRIFAPAQHSAKHVAATRDEADHARRSGQDKPPEWSWDLHKLDPKLKDEGYDL